METPAIAASWCCHSHTQAESATNSSRKAVGTAHYAASGLMATAEAAAYATPGGAGAAAVGLLPTR